MTTRFSAYTGNILDIDLTRRSVGTYALSDRDRERFIGGRFISTKILWDQLPPGSDPLSPANLLVVMTGPLTGTGAPSSSRYDISAKSPLTGAIGHSNSGGNFGIHLKRAGWDGIVVRGKADRPVYIEIEEDRVRIRSADALWGLDTEAAQAALGRGGKMVIGPAGERQVKYATVVSQERCHGRTGMGAVMGAKNLKAIVARGRRRTTLHDPAGFKAAVKKWVRLLRRHPATGHIAPTYGTAVFVNALSPRNALPTRNFSSGTFAGADRISGERLARERLVGNFGCPSCPIRCGRIVELDGRRIKGPEFEILCMLGSNMLIDDLDAIIRWNRELDLLGLDTITLGNVLGFAAELNAKGLWANGIEFGNPASISAAIPAIAAREGIGADLAEGVRFLAQKYGGGDFAAHVKGLEIAGYEPRAAIGHGLGYATANRGACHLDGGYLIYLEVSGPMTMEPLHLRSKPGWVVFDQNLLAAISAAGSCLFTSWTFVPAAAYKLPAHPRLAAVVRRLLTQAWPLVDALLALPPWLLKVHLPFLPYARVLGRATGMPMDFGRFAQAGARGFTLERLFNLREGVGRPQDSLARRFTHEPLVPGNPRSRVPLDRLLPKYYALRGWDANGVPTPQTLAKLDLDFAAPAA